ncbi:hypothetical protein RJ40_06015 [Methanofollis aquaemaris]|uniref:DUF3344 domain-containing protein n=1 Tax=Methanofollis aquaemaris TaxID=126734 RepID=A0A8A3S4U9_9EURY|nr:hypothetical protein [Methanofollis aquaemaris]QSZ67082.1 hypothetical protein RJ40_06015 [Methanofollis aquaemaris]
MKNEGKAMVLKVAMASAVVLMLAACVAPASAVDFADNNQTYIEMANGAFYDPHGDDTYYFNFSKPGGGLKAIHITNSITNKNGAVYANQNLNGTFYISDTSKDPGCSDSAILMFGVPGAANTTNLALSITASGYNWTLTPTIMFPPSGSLTHYSNVSIGTFGNGHFLKNGRDLVNCKWRPYFDEDYPMYYGQNMTNTSDTYKVMFIDTGLGTLNATGLNLTDNGMIKVDYGVTGYNGNALFDIYTWCNQSKQGKSVSWTNRITGTGSSGWTIGF